MRRNARSTVLTTTPLIAPAALALHPVGAEVDETVGGLERQRGARALRALRLDVAGRDELSRARLELDAPAAQPARAGGQTRLLVDHQDALGKAPH